MSKLDSALISYDQLEDPRLLDVPRSWRLLHVEGVTWCALHKTDGAISRAALRRLTDEPDAALGAAALVWAGLWLVTDTGWQIVDYTRNQVSAERIARIREATRSRQERWLQCRLGDHSKCKHNGVHNGVSNGVTNGRLLDSTRLDAAPTEQQIEAIGKAERPLPERPAARLCSECGDLEAVATWKTRPVCEDCYRRLSEPVRAETMATLAPFR